MENASKALIMAGGVMLALMIAAIGVYLINDFNQTKKSYTDTLDTAELNKYNSNFSVFIDRKDITAQEIVTVISIAQQKNLGTRVYVNGTNCTSWSESRKNRFLKENILTYGSSGHVSNLYSYVDGSVKYNSQGRITQIRFEKNI